MLDANISKLPIFKGGRFVSEEDYVFTYKILDSHLYSELKDYLSTFTFSESQSFLEKICGVDFLLVEQCGTISYLHVTSVENYDSIYTNGLLIDNDWVGDIGQGVYVIREDDLTAMDNLMTFVADDWDYDVADLLEVSGTYTGKYYECVYGTDHVGYICIPENIPIECISNMEITSVSDFL